MHRLVLASQSPRRRDLLEKAGYKFRVLPVKVSEILRENLNLTEAIEELALRKARACLDQYKDLKSDSFLIMSADTVVVLGADVLGKPQSEVQARETLLRLSGKTHSVITALALVDTISGREVVGHEVTQVTFRSLSRSEVDDYVASGEPMDKAGAYGIQGSARKFVVQVSGPEDNVIGLPLKKLSELIAENGWRLD